MKSEEVVWIKHRDKKAENDASEYAGGTMEGLVYVGSLADSTKERCYELVNTYMK
ncbi:lysozyme inhibitor LprI family protein [Terrisporobacter sp.]